MGQLITSTQPSKVAVLTGWENPQVMKNHCGNKHTEDKEATGNFIETCCEAAVSLN